MALKLSDMIKHKEILTGGPGIFAAPVRARLPAP